MCNLHTSTPIAQGHSFLLFILLIILLCCRLSLLFFFFSFKVCGFHFRRAHEPNLLIFTQNRSGSHSHTRTGTLKTDTHSLTSSKWWKCVWDDGFGGKVGGLGSVLVWSHWGWQTHTWMHGYSDDTHPHSWESSVFTLSCLTVLKL